MVEIICNKIYSRIQWVFVSGHAPIEKKKKKYIVAAIICKDTLSKSTAEPLW